MAAPKRPNTVGAKSDKEWRNAIRKAVHELRAADEDDKAKKIKGLTLLARRLVTGLIRPKCRKMSIGTGLKENHKEIPTAKTVG